MTLLYRLLFICCLLLPVRTAGQDVPGESSEEKIMGILQAVSAPEQLQKIPKSLKSEFAANPLGLQPSKNEILISNFEEAFIEDTLLGGLRKSFTERYRDEPPADSLLHILQSKSLQAGLSAKREFYTVEGTRKRIIRRYLLEQDPPSQQREALINTLVETTSTVDMMVESQAILFRGVISAFSELSPRQNFSELEIDNFVANYKIQIKQQISEAVKKQFMITYYDVEEETLRKMNTFFGSDAGKWLSKSLSEAIHETYRDAAERFVTYVNNTD